MHAAALRLGLSSGSMPWATAADLAQAVKRGTGTVADLRIGKGHRWEEGGVARGLAAVRAAGVEVAFVGVSARLGDPACALTGMIAEVPSHIPIKVFCTPTAPVSVIAAHLALAPDREIWVETHAGGPPAPVLVELAERTRIGLVIDLLGLLATDGVTADLLPALAPHVRSFQVKGVRTIAPGQWEHRRLRVEDLIVVRQILALGAPSSSAVTVESRAGTHEEDLRLLCHVLKRNPSATGTSLSDWRSLPGGERRA